MQPQPTYYYHTMPPGTLPPAGSAIAAVPVVPPGYHYPQPQAFITEHAPTHASLQTGLSVGELATGLALNIKNPLSSALGKAAGPIGVAATGTFSAVNAVLSADDERKALLDTYCNIVAGQMGIQPSQVTLDHLYAAADKFKANKALKEALEAIDSNQVKTPVKCLTNTTAGMAGFALPALLGLATGPIGATVAGLAGSFAASTVSDKAFEAVAGSNPIAYDHIKQMEAKLSSGQLLSPHDLFSYHVTFDKELNQQIEQRMGGAFHTLDEAAQARTMLRNHPQLYDLACHEAYAVNSKRLQPKDLMRGDVLEALYQEHENNRVAMNKLAMTPNNMIHTSGCMLAPMGSQLPLQSPHALMPAGAISHTGTLLQQRAQAPLNPVVGS